MARMDERLKRYRSTYKFMAVAARDVQVGDLYANNGTVTAVVVGPSDEGSKWMSPKRGEVLIRCGDDYACKGKSGRAIIVGRQGQKGGDSD